MTSHSQTPRRSRLPGLYALLAALVLLLGAVACSSEEDPLPPGDAAGESQPIAGTGLADGELANLPVPDGADVASELQEVNGAQTQSFIVTSSSPTEVLNFYTGELEALGWTAEDQEDFGEGVRGTWTMGSDELLIAATSQDGDDDTSLSIQLTSGG